MALRRKATFQPYDMDTAIGTNNSGVLMFGYSLEDTDTVSSIISGGDDGGTDAPVFNAQDSVLWNNVRDAFRAEISQMYQQLRTSGAWNAREIIKRAQDHQGQWCEAIYNEDQNYKHLIPLINPVTEDENGNLIRTDRYLTMLQGSKEEQRKWWITNRFRYMDSKYVTGDAVNSVISMRVFNSGTLTLTAATDLYLAVRFGGGSTPILQRRDANTPANFTYTAETGVTEMETWIYSADLITDVGDLSVFYGNEFDFSRATRLQRLKIGDSSPTYSNANLKALDVRNSALLEYIDVRNCPNLAITVNLEGSPRLKEAYFDGTSITGCDLADGASIEKLHLPSTITTLTLINLNKLTDFVCPDFSNVSRLMITNMDSDVVDPLEILGDIPANSQVNIQGLYFEATDHTEIESLLNLLDTMRGVSREKNASGEWMYHDYDTAQVSGEIHTASLTGAQIASYNARYPYITVTADTVISNLTYASYDGTTVYKVVECRNGVPQEGAPANPSRPATPQNTFTFIGWSKSMNSTTADADAAVDVIADRTIYAAYSVQGRTYTVRFYNGSTLLETDTGIPYGGSTTYDGTTPVDPSGQSLPFNGWQPAPTNIQGDTSCYAQFQAPEPAHTITDTWTEILQHVQQGDYATRYSLGDTMSLNLGDEGYINMQIVAFDTDDKADGSGKAPITWIAEHVLETSHRMNPALETNYVYPSDKSFVRNSTSTSNTGYNQWKSQNAYTANNTAKITFTVTAVATGTLRLKYVTGTADNCATTLKIDGTDVITSYSTSVQNYDLAITAGTQYVIEYETTRLNDTNSTDTYIKLCNTSDSGKNADVSALVTQDSVVIADCAVRTIDSYTTGTGAIGGYAASEMRTYIQETIKPLIPQEVLAAIKPVTKYTRNYNTAGTSVNDVTSTEDVWIPSRREMFTGAESQGPTYTSFFTSNADRVKKKAGASSASWWWLRSANASGSFYGVNTNGDVSNFASGAYGVVVGFCT